MARKYRDTTLASETYATARKEVGVDAVSWRRPAYSLFLPIAIIAFFWPSTVLFAEGVQSRARTCETRSEPILREAREVLNTFGLPPYFLALALAESCGKTAARSDKGAVGLWQLMPHTARTYGFVPDGRYDVDTSTHIAARYLRHLLAMFDGDLMWTVAAYNAGGHNLKRATGYRRGMDFERVRSVYPKAYALAITVRAYARELGYEEERQ